GCSRPDANRIGNSFLVTVIDVDAVRGRTAFEQDVEGLIENVKSAKLAPGFDKILVPGEPEIMERDRRLPNGIPITQKPCRQIAETCSCYGVDTTNVVSAAS